MCTRLGGNGIRIRKVVLVVFALWLLSTFLGEEQPAKPVGTVVAAGGRGAAVLQAMQDRQDAIRRSQMVVNAIWTRGGW